MIPGIIVIAIVIVAVFVLWGISLAKSADKRSENLTDADLVMKKQQRQERLAAREQAKLEKRKTNG